MTPARTATFQTGIAILAEDSRVPRRGPNSTSRRLPLGEFAAFLAQLLSRLVLQQERPPTEAVPERPVYLFLWDLPAWFFGEGQSIGSPAFP
ncbi:MAG: hypothetical protein VYC80_18445 [Planctomycetota bacterium]|nr:hypothetical protein [Planctomycetota bacterium]